MFSIPTPQTLAAKALCALVGAMILVGGGAYAGYRFELGRYEQLVAADAKAMTAAVTDAKNKEQRIGQLNAIDAANQAYFRGRADAMTVNLKIGVPANVTVLQDQEAAASDHAGCVTYGFVRVLVAGERIESPESFAIPSGESVDSCTALEPSKLAAAIAQDLTAGAANGHQLDSLIAAVKRNDAIVVGAVGVPSDVEEPDRIDTGDRQTGVPSQRQADDGIKPQVIDAPSAEKGSWQPMDTVQRLVPADSPDIEDLKYGTARLKGRLGEVRINVHLLLPDL